LFSQNLWGKKKPTAPQPRVEDTISNLRNNIDSLDKRSQLLSSHRLILVREKHIYTKIDTSKREAVMKKKKNDQKGSKIIPSWADFFSGAIFALKKMKMYEGEVNKLQGARMTLETQIASLEGAAINVEVFKAMQSGATAMKQIRGDLWAHSLPRVSFLPSLWSSVTRSAERVDDIMDEVQEEQELMNQISEAISRPAEDMYDEEELLAELDGLEDELEAELSAAPAQPLQSKPQTAQVPAQSVFNFPQVPVNQPVRVSDSCSFSSHFPQIAQQESEDEAALRELQASMMA
jgi:charged multivesicular body protein 4A/B